MQYLKVVRTGRPPKHAISLSHPNDVFQHLSAQLVRLDREHFIVLHLDRKNCLLAQETVSVGSLAESLAHPREVFKGAVLNGSAVVMLVHNHPSGDPMPSPADVQITQRLREVGELLGIPVFDHLIFGAYNYFSFANSLFGPERDTRCRTADPSGSYPSDWKEAGHA
jgi:DNA repair protein RadC